MLDRLYWFNSVLQRHKKRFAFFPLSIFVL